jgi:hypothetical protein
MLRHLTIRIGQRAHLAVEDLDVDTVRSIAFKRSAPSE